MGLTERMKGYMSNMRGTDSQAYKRFQKICYDNDTTPNQQFKKLVHAVARNGMIDLNELATGAAKKKQEVKQLAENASLVGAVNQLCETLMVRSVQDVQNQRSQLDQMVIQPGLADVQQLQEAKHNLSQQLEGVSAAVGEMEMKRRQLQKQLQEEAVKLQEAQQEYAQIKARAEQERQKQFVAAATQQKDVSAGKKAH
jgi:chromosome segregation ATPase